jgi:hypothetical protein
MGIGGYFPRLNQQGHEADHSSVPSEEAKKALSIAGWSNLVAVHRNIRGVWPAWLCRRVVRTHFG